MGAGFLITSPYQLFHYKQIAPHLDDVTAIVEVRKQDFGLREELIRRHLPGCDILWTYEGKLSELDGKFDVIVCQTPVLPQLFFAKSLVVAQQYSLAKELYQYGTWRSHADLNLMYGRRSTQQVAGFCRAVAVGNPLFDDYRRPRPMEQRLFRDATRRPRLLYAPTYGSLSSLETVLPRLSTVDADLTVKLHHAEMADRVTGLPEGVRIRFADTDPAALLAEQDGVISDFSGVAFDALAAGLPVVLTGRADPNRDDYVRLSSDERHNTLLADVTTMWEPRGDLLEAFAEAETHRDSAAYAEFTAENFSNLGAAGKAAASQIQRLLTDGPVRHFAADQVRQSTRRYISSNRQLRGKTGDLIEDGETPPAAATPVGRRPTRSMHLYRRTRAALAKFGPLRSLVIWLRNWARQRKRGRPVNLPVAGLSEPRPAYRRREIWRCIAPFLTEGGIKIAVDSDQIGAPVAVRVDDKRTLLRCLHQAAAEHPYLVVRVGSQQRPSRIHPLRDLAAWQVHAADWLELGALTESSRYERDLSGYLSITFVAHHPERRRILATRTVPDRPDWTHLFEACERADSGVAVGSRPRHPAAPVDVVYTWVNSRDARWQEMRQSHGGVDEHEHVSGRNEERFLDRDELRHSLRSLWMFAPFVRNIYIVTADQWPEWLSKTDPRVKVVSHSEIFPDVEALPTFNSHAIESCLHRIPGLAENFLYFNDDVFLGREVTESDFYTTAGLAKVRLSPSQYIYDGEPVTGSIPTDWAAYHSVRLIQRDFGGNFDRRVKHVPLVLKKSVLAEIEEKYPQELDRTRRSRFRSSGDLAVPSMFAQFYAISTARAVEWPDPKNSYVYLDTGKRAAGERFRWILDRKPMFYCLNSTRFNEVELAEQAVQLRRFYQRVLPHAAPWEIDVATHGRRSTPPADELAEAMI